jgi:hypothetical protein
MRPPVALGGRRGMAPDCDGMSEAAASQMSAEGWSRGPFGDATPGGAQRPTQHGTRLRWNVGGRSVPGAASQMKHLR